MNWNIIISSDVYSLDEKCNWLGIRHEIIYKLIRIDFTKNKNSLWYRIRIRYNFKLFISSFFFFFFFYVNTYNTIVEVRHSTEFHFVLNKNICRVWNSKFKNQSNGHTRTLSSLYVQRVRIYYKSLLSSYVWCERSG